MTTLNKTLSQDLVDAPVLFEKMPPLYLVYSLFYFFPLLFMPNLGDMGAGWWLAMLGIYGGFIGLALVNHFFSPAQRAWCLIGIIVLATLGAKVSVGTSSFFAYLPFYALLYYPTAYALRWMAASIVGIVIAAWLTDFAWYFWAPAIGVFILNTVTAFIELQEKRLLAATTHASHLAERERIAHNLHDVTGHHLTAISLKAQLAQKLIAAQHYDKAREELTSIAELAAANRSAIRNAIEGELPSNVQANYTALINLLKNQGFQWRCEGELPLFTAQASPQIVAILSEAMTNVLRHASPKNINCHHIISAQGFTMTLTNPVSHANINYGIGINSMQKRAVALGGQLTFTVNQNLQALLCLSLPRSVLINPST